MTRDYDSTERAKDPLDLSKENAEREVHDQIKRIQSQAKRVDATAKGECLNCGKDFKPEDRRRWCNDVCRDEWEEVREHQKRNPPYKRR